VPRPSPRRPKRAAAGPRRRASTPSWWRVAAALALLAGAVIAVLWVARRPATPAPAPAPDAAALVRAVAARHGSAAGDVVEDEVVAPDAPLTITVHAAPGFATERFALELQAEAHNGGGRLDPRPVTETGGYGLARLDGTLAGRAVRVVVLGEAPRPRGAARAGRAPREAARGRLAVVLDDAGNSLAAVEALARLPAAVAVAVLPNAPQAVESARELGRQGREVLLHMPMEPLPGHGPGPGDGAIAVGQPAAEVAARLAGALALVPGARGVNNHMGSRATADGATMRALMAALRGRGLYFLDSRTSAASVAADTAREEGIPALRREVFLDLVDEPDAVRRALAEAVARAAADGEAVAIGHVHPVTVDVLAGELAALPKGISLVRPSALAR